MNFADWWDSPNGAAGVRRAPDRPYDEDIARAAFEAGRAWERAINARLLARPMYAELAAQIQAERHVEDERERETWRNG